MGRQLKLAQVESQILQYSSYALFPDTGSEGYIYIDNSANIGYLWDSGSIPPTYVNIAGPSTPPEPIPLTFANAATVLALSPSPLYDNGVSGSGAVLTGSINGVLSDGTNPGKIDYIYTPAVGDVILVKNQPVSTVSASNRAFQNGLYTITNTGSASSKYVLTRTDEYDVSSELFPLQVNILVGTNNNNKSFIQSTANPVIGTSNLVFSAASPSVSVAAQIAFVDTVIDTPLTNIVYATGSFSSVVPGSGATITSTVSGSLGTWNGLSVNTNSNVTGSFTQVLVINQTNPAYNGDYSVITTGSATVAWKLKRINTNASGFDRYTRFFLVSNTSSSKAGRMYFTRPNSPALTNATIGTAPINIFEYGGGTSTSAFPYTGSALITGSLGITGSFNVVVPEIISTTREEIAKFEVLGITGSRLSIENGTNADGQFTPAIFGLNGDTNREALLLFGVGGIDTGSTAISVFDSRIGLSGGTSFTSSVERPLFQWRNFGTRHMTMGANGNLVIGGIISASAKLHINNTTPSASFLVEDSTNPDVTPFVIDTDGKVGIGTTTPSASLDVNGNVKIGLSTTASGTYSHAEGYFTFASGSYSHAEGNGTRAIGVASHAEGQETQAIGYGSHVEGYANLASGSYSHAEGLYTTASGYVSHAEGYLSFASGSYSHAEGQSTQAIGVASHAEGFYTTASGNYSHAEGRSNLASGDYSHAEGLYTTASGLYSHAEGYLTFTSSSYSHAEGQSTQAIGVASHAEGYLSFTSGSYSHAEGYITVASGFSSHAEGGRNLSPGDYSHAEGTYTTSSGYSSHAEGQLTIASGIGSHAEGLNTIASGSYQHVQGQFNLSSSIQSAFILGNGTSESTRSNLIFAAGSTVQITGSLNVSGSITGSLQGTATTASFVTASNVIGTVTSASFATSASWAPSTGGGSSFPFTGSALITGSLGVTGSLSITGSTSTDLVRITQTGTGNAFVVEDSTNPDSTPFVIDNVGRVGIGTTTPTTPLDIVGTGAIVVANFKSTTTQGTLIDLDTATTSSYSGIRFYTSGSFGGAITYQPIGDYIQIGNNWVSGSEAASFDLTNKRVGIGKLSPTATLDITGSVLVTGSVSITQNVSASRASISSSNGTVSGSSLTVYGSGSALPVFAVQGSQGELFSITDSLSGSLFSVNDISGLPILEVFSDSTTLIGNYQDPMLITTAKTVQTNSGSFVVYSLPTASYDTAFFEYSIRSGSNARAGTIMAIQSGSSVNFTETTTTDFGNTSAVSFAVVVTGSNMALTGSSTTGSWTTKCIVRGL